MATYDLSTDVGVVRNIIRDTDTTDPMFEDDELEAFLTLNSDDVRLAAADALDAWASDQALVLKVVRTLDLSTDGASVARSLREHASRLRALAEQEDDDSGLDIAELALGPFSIREQVLNEAIRDA